MRTIALSVTVCGLALAVAGISVGNDFDLLLQDLSFGNAPSIDDGLTVDSSSDQGVEILKPDHSGIFMPVVGAPGVQLQSPQNAVAKVVVEPDVNFEALFNAQNSTVVAAEPVSIPMDMHPEMIVADAFPWQEEAAEVEAPAISAPAIDPPAAAVEAVEPTPVVPAEPPVVPQPPVEPQPVQPEPVQTQPELLPVHPDAVAPESPVVMPLSDPAFIESGHCGDAGHCGSNCDCGPTIQCPPPYMKPNLPHSSFYQYFRSNPCYSNVWDGYQRYCSPCHCHIHGTCDCFKCNKKSCGGQCDSGCDR